MQRLVYLCTGTSRFFRINGVNYLKTSELLFSTENSLLNTNNFVFKRCLATDKKGSKNVNKPDIHADLYKPSTVKAETHVPDDLKGQQSPETINSSATNNQTGSGKVWSAQNQGSIHVAPLGRVSATTFVPTSSENGNTAHETTVYSTKGQVNIADPFKTHNLQPEASPAKLAEAAAASAFQPFAPDAAPTSSASTETVFAPKISSTDVYSTTSSPTAHFDTAASSPSSSTQQEPPKYEKARRAKVFGGQDTSADTGKHPKENPFDMKPVGKPKPTN